MIYGFETAPNTTGRSVIILPGMNPESASALRNPVWASSRGAVEETCISPMTGYDVSDAWEHPAARAAAARLRPLDTSRWNHRRVAKREMAWSCRGGGEKLPAVALRGNRSTLIMESSD